MGLSSDRLRTKRAYEDPSPADGRRVLIDGLWPRGRKKEDLRLDWWARELAPSRELRQWYGHQPARWEEFRARFLAELRASPAGREALSRLRAMLEEGPVTLVYASKEEERCNAGALRGFLLEGEI